MAGWSLRGVGAVLVALVLAGGYFWVSTDLPAPDHLRARAARSNTRILDRNGRVLDEIPDPLSGRQRPLPLEEIPLTLRQATIAIEDRRFYHHPGLDLRGILRAAWHNLTSRSITAGGSTITQQLARNFLLDPQMAQQRTLERKIREAVLALKLSSRFSKDEILALYLNQTFYGGMSYGVEAAAQHLFGKPARDLDLAESALLAGLPQAPSSYNPLTNLKAARERQKQVLAAMVREGFITPAQSRAAWDEPLQFATSEPPMHAPHFVFAVLDQLAAACGPDAVTRGGLVVTTTLDIDLQAAAQAIVERRVALLSTPRHGDPGHHVRNGAVVVLDPSDGAILAMVGSPDFGDAAIQGQVNGALAPRQPGSAIKPLTYAAALERGWTPATMVLDAPSAFPTREGRPYRPENYDRTYHGLLSLREALATSSNVAAVQVLHSIGVPSLLDMAGRLGITSLQSGSGRYGLALTLGGGEVTLLELTAAYAAFANGGFRVAPYAIVAVEGGGACPVLAGSTPGEPTKPAPHAEPEPEPALSPQVAYLISDMLSDRYARMRAFGEQSILDIARPAAVKTGTTGDWRDNWTVGYTPDRVVGVWVGNADGQPMESVSGVSGAGPIWHDVMLAAHRDIPPRPFPRPDGIDEALICAGGTGANPPGTACAATRLERFIAPVPAPALAPVPEPGDGDDRRPVSSPSPASLPSRSPPPAMTAAGQGRRCSALPPARSMKSALPCLRGGSR
ncbi:MAG: PBP1A family penicillin-binding protein [Chloroflexaceae bacterium]|nr:PBP1A family penicillin-binding protein [Chloroflexaceae bacterium]